MTGTEFPYAFAQKPQKIDAPTSARELSIVFAPHITQTQPRGEGSGVFLALSLSVPYVPWLAQLRGHKPSRLLRITHHFHGCRLGIAIENRIDMLHDVSTHIQEVALVLDRNESALRAIVLRDLKRLR